VRTVLAVLAAFAAVATVGTGSGAVASAAVLPGTPPRPIWMLSVGALARLARAGLPSSLLSAELDRPSTILLGGARHADPLAPHATRAADFTSAAALVRALAHKAVPADVPDVVLDLEAWPLTPSAEQHHPIAAAHEALVAAERAHKVLVFTPGTDLLRVLVGDRLTPGQRRADYDRLLAGPGARASDVFEVQAQGTEGTAAATAFAPSAIASARAARPGVPVLVGLSTNPDGRRVTPADLLAVVAATAHRSSGYWLNIPSAGTACPRCGVAQPQVGVAFLEELATLSPPSASLTSYRPPLHGGAHRAIGASPRGGILSSAGAVLAAGGRPAEWVLAASHFTQVTGSTVVRRRLGGTVFEPVTTRQRPAPGLAVVPTLVVHDETLLDRDLHGGTVPVGTGAVLYDNERYPDTPLPQQQDPGSYDTAVAALAARHHWTSICDLIQPDRLSAADRTPAHEVPACAVVGLNTVQQSERNPSRYAAIVAHDVSMVHTVAPGRPVLAGLSANPSGATVTAAELTEDMQLTHGVVAGWWLNVPAPGVGCPRCRAPDPSVMATAIADLGSEP